MVNILLVLKSGYTVDNIIDTIFENSRINEKPPNAGSSGMVEDLL